MLILIFFAEFFDSVFFAYLIYCPLFILTIAIAIVGRAITNYMESHTERSQVLTYRDTANLKICTEIYVHEKNATLIECKFGIIVWELFQLNSFTVTIKIHLIPFIAQTFLAIK